jgi:ankyrin repeat protein
MTRLKTAAFDTLSEHAQTNKPDFVSIPLMLKAAQAQGLDADLLQVFEGGGVEPQGLRLIRLGELHAAKAYFQTGPSIADMTWGNGWGPLHFAACFDRPTIMPILVSHGADVDKAAGVDTDSTPLAIAARKGYARSVEALIGLGAQIDPPFTGVSRIPLREAIMFSDDSQRYLDTVSILLKHNAIHSHGGHGTTAVHNAPHLPLTLTILLRHDPASVRFRDMAKATVLHHAIRRRCLKSVIVLLERGADVNAEDECGFTPLHIACRMCMLNPTSVHSRELEDYLASLAVGPESDRHKIIEFLKLAGANIDAASFGGRYGSDKTPDLFLYDVAKDITEFTVNFKAFQGALNDGRFVVVNVSEENSSLEESASAGSTSIVPTEDEVDTINFEAGVLLPGRGRVEYEYIVPDIIPNSYELVACFGPVGGAGYTPPEFLAFKVDAEVC